MTSTLSYQIYNSLFQYLCPPSPASSTPSQRQTRHSRTTSTTSTASASSRPQHHRRTKSDSPSLSLYMPEQLTSGQTTPDYGSMRRNRSVERRSSEDTRRSEDSTTSQESTAFADLLADSIAEYFHGNDGR